jgi:hypothetical protein
MTTATATDRGLHLAKLRATRFVNEAFPPGTPARSIEYKRGMREFFLFSLVGNKIICPYTQGTSEFDAFFAGVDAGRAISRRDADK